MMALKPTYAIIAPSKIRPNSDYHVSVDIFNASQPVDIEVEVSGQEKDGQPVNRVTSKICVQPSESSSSSVNLNIGEWKFGKYKLIVKGNSGELDFADERYLEFEHKSCSFFVQTDKAIYKPGQSVKFRVIVVNSCLIPNVTRTLNVFVTLGIKHELTTITLNLTDKAIYKPGQSVKFRVIVVNSCLIPNVTRTLNVFVKDPQNNLIKQWNSVLPKLGVFAEEMQLSDQPPLGNWSIRVEKHENPKQNCTKEFTVAEYVLPTFSVDVEIPPYATYAQSEVVATVKANYTYGKPVKGECILTLQKKHFNPSVVPRKFTIQTKITDNGVVEIPINLVEFLNLNQDISNQEIEFHAIVKENFTGKQNSSSSALKIYQQSTKVELVKPLMSKTVKPGLKYTAFLKVAYQDDKPVEDNGPAVKLKYIFTKSGPIDWTAETAETQVPMTSTSTVPVKGIACVELNPTRNDFKPDDDDDDDDAFKRIDWNAEYRGTTYHFESVEFAKSPSNSFIQVIANKNDHQSTLVDLLNDENLASVGEKVNFKVSGVEPLGKVAYKVISKGNIVLGGTVQTSDQTSSSSIDFTIPVTKQMAPSARLLVYYVRAENQEIVADVLNFKVDGVFGTSVEMSSNVNETEPGGQVDITVQTQPSAYVALLGVDQSILLLKSGNDLTRGAILQDLKLYDSWVEKSSSLIGEISSQNVCYQSSTAQEIFDNSGLVIFTNGVVYEKKRKTNPNAFLAEIWDIQEPESPKPEVAPVRQKFPETWIWTNVTAGLDGFVTISDTIPDSITSWIISAFSIDSTTGLGVAKNNLKINVFRPFFAQLSLPYSIIRGESVEIQVLVFNYQNKPVQAKVVMCNAKNEFVFVHEGKQKQQQIAKENKHRKTVSIGPFDGSSVCFTITPTKIGYIDIRVSATCDNAGDALVKKLLVKPEGQTQYFNKTMFIKLDQQKSNCEKVKQTFTIEIPKNAVPDSVKIKVSGISDILGSTVNHIDDLLRMPRGCGEQNMINFVPNVVALKYLTLVNRLTDEFKAKSLANIFTGYQRELTYRRDDGSFSAFGNSDRAGSTWLTAFVVKSFIQARPYLDLDQHVLNAALRWLFRQQAQNGSFVEEGEVHHRTLQGGASKRQKKIFSFSSIGQPEDNSVDTSPDNYAAALTAYVLIAILHEDRSNSIIILNEKRIKFAENYIYSRLSVSNNSYEIALIAHALHLADSQNKDASYQKLMKLIKRDGDGLAYWTTKVDEKNNKAPESTENNENSSIFKRQRKIVYRYERIPNFVEVECTAYALLTLVARSDTDHAIASLRWLISKQNSNGGFASTQDTVIALQALGAIAEKMFISTPLMSVSVKHGNSSLIKREQMLTFDAQNALVLQQLELEPDSEWVELEASGYGTAIVQVSHQYNIAQEATEPAFYLKTQVDKSSTENYLLLKIETYYTNGDSTNMTVLEVELPSGYTADLDALKGEKQQIDGIIKRVETDNNGATVFVYFDRVTAKPISLKVGARRSHRVENCKPVPITIYDYSDRNQMARIFY